MEKVLNYIKKNRFEGVEVLNSCEPGKKIIFIKAGDAANKIKNYIARYKINVSCEWCSDYENIRIY